MPREIIQRPEATSGRLGTGLIALVVAVDLAARIAAPASLLAVARSHAAIAMSTSALVAALAAIRALLVGRAQQASVRELWERLIAATRGRSIASLRLRGDEHGTVALIDAVAIVASVRVGVITRVAADVLALAVVIVAAWYLLDPSWIMFGAIAFAVGAAIILTAHAFMRRADARAYAHFTRVAHDFEVLADAATELRAHACEARHAAALDADVQRMAHEQRRATTYSAMAGFLPLAVALLVISAPFGLDLASLAGIVGTDIVDAGVLGATGLFLGLGLARSIEGWTRSAPQRRALASFVATTSPPSPTGSNDVALGDAVIELDGVSVIHDGAERATPADASIRWEPGHGLAILGPNGAGKSTLALCLLGLVAPTRGEMTIGGVPWRDITWERVRQRIVFLPQGGYFAEDRSVAWHLQLLAHVPPEKDAIERALRRVGLWEVLSRRQARPLDVPVSQLSGGERRRLQLARSLLGDPDLVVLDEPEAGLDDASRGWLSQLLAELAAARRVVVIAHDPSVIPPDFARLTLAARAVDADSAQALDEQPSERHEALGPQIEALVAQDGGADGDEALFEGR